MAPSTSSRIGMRLRFMSASLHSASAARSFPPASINRCLPGPIRRARSEKPRRQGAEESKRDDVWVAVGADHASAICIAVLAHDIEQVHGDKDRSYPLAAF